ncbi:MAG: guanylate kinase [Chloroflexota bacterium]|nr:guanylate kinase [Chloroflexota bacterium]
MDKERRFTQHPLVVVISGPSGVGKDVIIDQMIASKPTGFHFVVTTTTRSPRQGEQEGINHNFVSVDHFKELIQSDKLLEWARVYDNYYGVPRTQVRDALAAGKHVIIRVDVQGAKRLKEIIPKALLIFIAPPSLDVLRFHLKKRGVDTENEMTKRLFAATQEIPQAELFDFTVTNKEHQLDETVNRVIEIIETESLEKPPRKIRL